MTELMLTREYRGHSSRYSTRSLNVLLIALIMSEVGAIDASQSDLATKYANGVTASRYTGIAGKCLLCAYKSARRNITDGYGAVVVIPWEGLVSDK